jgi:predicted GNAT family acetyltransferase
MIVQHRRNNGKGFFYVETDGNILAEMVYTLPSDSKMIIEHTEVSDVLRGKNVGYQLVSTAVEYARTHNMKIIPLCPFTNAVFKKKPEYADVIYV